MSERLFAAVWRKIRKDQTRPSQPVADQQAIDREYYLQAAERGDIHAQYNLANMYRAGYGVSQDYAEALKWYKSAAEHGHIHAQFNLGQIYEKGHIDRLDFLEAMKWYCRSAKQGYEPARLALQDLRKRGFRKDSLHRRTG